MSDLIERAQKHVLKHRESRDYYTDSTEVLDIVEELLEELQTTKLAASNQEKRIHQFDTVIRNICTELNMTYAGVDVDNNEIVEKIKANKLAVSELARELLKAATDMEAAARLSGAWYESRQPQSRIGKMKELATKHGGNE